MAFKYIATTKEDAIVTLNDVLTTGTELNGTSYYNESSVKRYVFVENAPLTKFLAKDVFHAAVNDTNPYVNLENIDKNFELQKTKVSDVLYYAMSLAPEGQNATGHINCDYTKVRKDTFPHALVSEVTGADSDVNDQNAGMRFLIAIPSTRKNDKSEWERANFDKLFTLSESATFHPNINTDEESPKKDGNVIITFNDSVKVAIDDVKNGDAVIAKGGTIISDGKYLSVVCTDDLYNEISLNGIKSIKLEIVDNRTIEPIEMAPGEGFVGE